MAAVNNEESSSSMCEFPYHVFLSFRGEDTRKSFTDHLYTALKWAGIHVFRDDDAIERGAYIECEVEKAIRQSKMSLIVFSSDFASSSWCLDEVAMIMEHKKHHSGYNVLPVFYDVDPSEVQKQTGDLAEAFSGDGKRFKDEKIEGWRSALCKVTNLAGMVLHKRPEAGFIQDIVKKVREMLKRTILHVPSYLVGVDAQVKDINNWIQDRPEDVNIAVIHGIGGVGKTTIAKNVCNLNFEQFDCWSFLKDVRKTSKQYNGLVQLQMQLLSDLSKGGFQKINNVDEGIIQIRYATRFKKVLIVLDDVDDVDQLKSILEVGKWLYKGSKIIITTRHGRLQSFHDQPCKEFRIMPLDESESLQLFSWHAFRQPQPSEYYLQDSKTIVRYCGGLPLAVEVIGFSLSGRTGDSWKRAMREPEALDGGKIHEILRVSYDSLQDDRDKNLFLDIACFFIGEELTFVETLVESCDSYRNVGIEELIDRDLISIDKDNKLAMHQLLRDMGREIVRQESPENHGARSRIWRHDDSFKILRKKTGSRCVKSFILDWEQVNIVSKRLVDLNTDAFASMGNLKLIRLNSLRLNGGYENFPKGLVWLCWHNVPWDYIPTEFYLEDLIVLELCNSSLRHVWHGTRSFPELKILTLSHCHGLVRTPDFSGLAALEILKLEECTDLVEVHGSIGNLQKLTDASLKDCINLRTLPDEISLLRSLAKLDLRGCKGLGLIETEAKKGWREREIFRSSLFGGKIREEAGACVAENDYHVFCGDLGNEVNDDVLSKAFSRFPSFNLARGSRSVKSFILDWEQVNIASKCLVDLNTDAFASMDNLKLIRLNSLRLKGGYENFPKGLVWLCWHHVPWDYIPTKFYLEDLIVLELCNSSLRHVWHGTRSFPELKILTLSHCHGLVRTPDFSGLTALEILKLEECPDLVEVHGSIGNLQKLTDASLKGCINLRRLPDEISLLRSLEGFLLLTWPELSGISELERPGAMDLLALPTLLTLLLHLRR